ncbi:PID domain-containing protein, partial [Trichonephila clavata]
MCKDYFLNALKVRKEEINELNYFINCLHFRKYQLPSKESAVVTICRQLLVKLLKMRMREVRNVESIFVKLIDAEEDIVSAVPKVYSFSKDVYTSFLQELEDQYNSFQAISVKIPDVYLLPDYKELYQELKQLEEANIQKVEETVLKFQEREHFIDIEVFSLCSKLFKNAVEDRKKEFDELVNDFDLLEATEVDDADFEGIEMINNCRNVFLTSIVLREKEIEVLENGMKKSSDFSIIQILLSESEKNEEIDEVLPVVYSLKDIFEVVSLGLKQKHNQESDDPTTAKNLEIYSTLEEFLSMAFDFKQKEVEIPFADLKKDLENILSSMIRELKERENKRILKCKRHLQ